MIKKMSNKRNPFDMDLMSGQFSVFIINSYGQILLFSGEPFIQEKNRNEESIRIFDTYENAVNFAQNITLPATAKTYCICDHNWKCIKSGTGDEEQKYTLHSKKVKFSKNERIIPQIMSPSGMKLYKERQDSSGRGGVLCGLSNYYKTFKGADFFFFVPAILFIVFGIRFKFGFTDILGGNANFIAGTFYPILIIYLYVITKIDKRFAERKPMTLFLKLLHCFFWSLTPLLIIYLIWSDISFFRALDIGEGILILFFIWILYKYFLFGFEYYPLFLFGKAK